MRIVSIDNEIEGHPTYLSDDDTNIDMGAVLTQEKKVEVIEFIKSNNGKISQREIARRLGIGKTTANRLSNELGFHHIKYTADERFFGRWNENSSYILGLIFADGNIGWNPRKSYRTLTITASEKDVNHLEKLRNILSSTKPLLYSEKTKSYRLTVTSKKICKKLMLLGIKPRKSLTAKFPKIPKKYLTHFIRGVIDGDGNVRYVNRKRSPYFEITISSGSKRFLIALVRAIKEKVGVDTKIRKVAKNTYTVQYSCARGKKLAKFVYSDANIYLERKFLQYKLAGGGDGL